MTWNYRIVKVIKERYTTYNKECKLYEYMLTEVFYHSNGSVMAYSADNNIYGESPEEIIECLEMMLKDAKKDQPILEEEDFKKVNPDYDLDDGQLTDEQYKLIQKEANKTMYTHDEMVDKMLQNPKVLEEYNKIKDE
jgi:hypothetical protein